MAPLLKGFVSVKQIVKTKTPLSIESARYLTRFFSSSADKDDNWKHDQHLQKPPEPIPNRPLRGRRPSDSDSARPRYQPPQQSSVPFFKDDKDLHEVRKKKDDSQSDRSFLEQFKLGLDRSKQNPQPEQRQGQQVDKACEPLAPPEDADEIFKKMKETGLIPNAVSMLDGLCKDGLVQEAMKLFGLMREKGTIPEVVIYTAVVEGFCKAHKFDDAKRIFQKMQTNGILPNAFSYTVIIQGLCKCSELDDAIEFSVEMLEAGHSPNVSTFVGLVDALCRDKDIEAAQTVIATLKQKGFVVKDKEVRDYFDKKAPFSPLIWEAIFGEKTAHRSF